MAEDFSKYLIKDYKYWALNVHRNQGFLGRCVVLCKRENALDLTDATKEEQEELFFSPELVEFFREKLEKQRIYPAFRKSDEKTLAPIYGRRLLK